MINLFIYSLTALAIAVYTVTAADLMDGQLCGNRVSDKALDTKRETHTTQQLYRLRVMAEKKTGDHPKSALIISPTTMTDCYDDD